jgi:hypothetical protein
MNGGELTAKLAKLLRLACSNGPDGERFAAINRVAAIVVARDIDWDAALGSADAVLPEEAMARIYSEGDARGAADERQRANPKPDWSPITGTLRVGEQLERVQEIPEAAERAEEAGHLTSFEAEFVENVGEQVDKYGRSTFVSEKQWNVINRLAEKLERCGFI